MPRVVFAPHLLKHVDCPPSAQPGRTVRECLEAAFAAYPRARGYVLEDHGALRKHVVVFVGDRVVTDRAGLSDPVGAADDVFAFQALSGG
jgi:hypothetical protein